MLEGWLGYPSEAWPDEALERGLPRPLRVRGENWGRTGLKSELTDSAKKCNFHSIVLKEMGAHRVFEFWATQ